MSELLQTLVEEDFGYEKEGKDWGRAKEHSSLVVNEKNQKWYWNSKEIGGDATTYLIKVRGLNKRSAREIVNLRNRILSGIYIEEKETLKQVAYEKLVDLFWEYGKEHRDYWYERKLTDTTIDRHRLGYFEGWNLIPLYVNDGFVNFQCRRDVPEKKIKMWYKIEGWKPVLVNSDILQLVDTVYITEGPVDALLLSQEGIPTVSHTGGAGYWNLAWGALFHRIKDIVYIMDNDESGFIAAKKVANGLGVNRVRILKFDKDKKGYDAVDFFKDGGTAAELKELASTQTKYLFELGEPNENRTRHRRRY